MSMMINVNKFGINYFQSSNRLNALNRKYNNYGDTVSFGQKKVTYNNFLKSMENEGVPQRISDEINRSIQNGMGDNLYEPYKIHSEVYAMLKEAKTLDEAKKYYPEFRDVKEFEEMDDVKKKQLRGKYRRILLGEEKAPEGGVALHILKYIYALEDEKDTDGRTLRRLAENLGIPLMGKKYSFLVRSNMPERCERLSKLALERWSDEEFSSRIVEKLNRPENKEKMRESSLALWQSDGYRERMSKLLSERWKNPEYREKMNTEEIRKKRSENAKRIMSDKSVRMHISEACKAFWQDEEKRAEQIRKINSPEVKEAYRKAGIERWKNPEYRQKMMDRMSTKEFSEFMSENIRKLWAEDEEYRKRMTLAPKLAREQMPELNEYAKSLRDNNPLIRVLFAKQIQGETLTEKEQNILNAYYKSCWEYKNSAKKFGQILKEVHKQLKTENSD